MTPSLEDALAQLRAGADPERAAGAAAYHKAPRPYLGLRVPEIDAMAKTWRQTLSVEERIALAAGLWDSDIHEAKVAAAKLLTQARIRPDDSGAWRLIASWAPGFDAWAIADHACDAGARRLVADPSRIDEVEAWARHPNMWTRRAALVITLPWTKMNHPSSEDQAIRARVLGWAASYVPDGDWFIQKAIAWWLRELSKHDAPRAAAFLAEHGAGLKAFARREAGKHLG
ncbi:DNA alkylation repair protein [Solirhodobacter olei]|uniref:DNA alkylation repair protein n=1 Tax=Solirhodobacter olei TaxID=2493082 RepID=UPI000FD7C6A2|nr:DNA alkylation repair protein [Solirhodobacter olei]